MCFYAGKNSISRQRLPTGIFIGYSSSNEIKISIMKKALLILLAALSLASCKKENGGGFGSAATSATATYAALNIKTSAQQVKVFVTAGTLDMIYNEDVTLLMDSTSLGKSWAVHLKEAFTGTELEQYDYHSLTKYGVNATNWVDDNLSNIVIHSTKDTLIAGKIYVKKRITRSFIYQKEFGSTETAYAAMNDLIKKTDIITFTAYYAPEDPQVAKTVNTAKLTYVKMQADNNQIN